MKPWLLLLLALVASPLSAQSADVGPQFVRYGVVERADRRVRIGQNHGNALAIAGRVEHGWMRGSVWFSPTQAVTDTASSDNPAPGAVYDDIHLFGLTVGAGHRFGPVGVAGGAGGLALTCSFRSCGSSPMFGWLVSADADLCLGDRLRVCLRGGTSAVPPRDGRWTWLADRADPDRRDDPEARHGQGWWWVKHLGVSVGLVLGGG